MKLRPQAERATQESPSGSVNNRCFPKAVFKTHCHEVEHRRKDWITLVDCLTRQSVSEGGEFPQAPNLSRCEDMSEGLRGRAAFLLLHIAACALRTVLWPPKKMKGIILRLLGCQSLLDCNHALEKGFV